MKTFRSIEFRDNEGELVIRHGFMDDSEAEKLMTRLCEAGATEAQICDLTPMSTREVLVIQSGDETTKLGC